MNRGNHTYHWVQDYILEASGNNLQAQHLPSLEIILMHIKFWVTGGMGCHQEMHQMWVDWSAWSDAVAPWK